MKLSKKQIVITAYGFLNNEEVRSCVVVDDLESARIFTEFLDEVAGIPACVTIDDIDDDRNTQFLYGNEKFFDYIKRFAKEEKNEQEPNL